LNRKISFCSNSLLKLSLMSSVLLTLLSNHSSPQTKPKECKHHQASPQAKSTPKSAHPLNNSCQQSKHNCSHQCRHAMQSWTTSASYRGSMRRTQRSTHGSRAIGRLSSLWIVWMCITNGIRRWGNAFHELRMRDLLRLLCSRLRTRHAKKIYLEVLMRFCNGRPCPRSHHVVSNDLGSSSKS